MPDPRFYKNFSPSASYSLRDPIRPTCLLFAEGDAEALFLERWLNTLGRDPEDIAVLCYRGGNLELLLRNLSEDANFRLVERFGFFLDAEAGTANQKATMVTALLRRSSVIPNGTAVQAGILLTVGAKRIALYVSPDNANPGFIEHIVMNEIGTHPFAPCIEAYRECIAAASGAPVNPKSLVQAYLGARNPRLSGTGRGFNSGVLQVTHDAYLGIRNTLGAIL